MEILAMIELILSNPKLVWAAVSSVVAIGALVSIIRAHFDEKNPLDLLKLFAFDLKTGQMSESKVKLNSAFIVTTWAFIFLTMSGSLTEWYVGVYLAAWVYDRHNSRKMAAQQEQGPKDDLTK